MPTVELSTGISTFYQVEGTGDVLLLIMGTGADHSTWDAQVECYSKHFKVISFLAGLSLLGFAIYFGLQVVRALALF